jgi:putative nucleotidyltransferase with HDIG domain
VSAAAVQAAIERIGLGLTRLFADPGPAEASEATLFDRHRPVAAAIVAAATRLGGLAAGSGLLARLNNPRTPLGAVASLVAADPILAGHVLKVANSPLYGLRGSLADVEKAIVVLGLGNLRALVFADLLDRSTGQDGPPRPARRRLLVHMARTAVLARRIAPALSGLDPAMAYTAGLLHDVGQLVLPPGHISGCSPTDEVACCGEHHGAAGGAVCRSFDLPEGVAQAVRLHHAPCRVELEDLGVSLAEARAATALALADGLAWALDGAEAAASPPLRHSYRFLVNEAALAEMLADPGLVVEMERTLALVRLACGEAA